MTLLSWDCYDDCELPSDNVAGTYVIRDGVRQLLHHHCGNCGAAGTSKLGHWRGESFTCEADAPRPLEGEEPGR